MRGIEFVYPSQHDCRFDKLFEGLPLEDYQIVVPWSDILSENKHISCPKIMDINDFSNLFCDDIALEMTAYFFKRDKGRSESKHQAGLFETYDDFLKSDCQMVFLLIDCGCVEIYAKSEEWLCKLLGNAERLGVQEIAIKTETTDGRNRLYV